MRRKTGALLSPESGLKIAPAFRRDFATHRRAPRLDSWRGCLLRIWLRQRSRRACSKSSLPPQRRRLWSVVAQARRVWQLAVCCAKLLCNPFGRGSRSQWLLAHPTSQAIGARRALHSQAAQARASRRARAIDIGCVYTLSSSSNSAQPRTIAAAPAAPHLPQHRSIARPPAASHHPSATSHSKPPNTQRLLQFGNGGIIIEVEFQLGSES